MGGAKERGGQSGRKKKLENTGRQEVVLCGCVCVGGCSNTAELLHQARVSETDGGVGAKEIIFFHPFFSTRSLVASGLFFSPLV